MANVRTDDVQIKLDIDASQSKTELDNLTRRAQVIKNDLKEMKRGTDEYIAANKELREVSKRVAELHQELGTAGLSMAQLGTRSKQLNRELKDLVPGTEEFISKSKQLAEVDTRLEQVRGEVRGVRDELTKAGGGFLDFVKKSAAFAGVQLGVQAVVGSLKQLASESIDAAAQGSDSIADMEKSLNVTTAEAKALREQLEGIDTRTSQENLEGIAIAAGQLGIAKDEAIAFTESVDQAVVALGDEFSGGVEDVTKSLGGLQKLFKETKEVSPAEAITKIGSAVNALGADGQATGPVIADFTARIGQLGDLAPQITQTLGLGAAFQELGLSAEISSGGLTNVLLTASKDTAGFAKQIGVTDQEFQKLINSDPNEVILQLAESFKGASNTEIISTLDGLGVKSQEATKVVSLLATQTDFVRQKQALASAEFEKGTSLYEEFLKKNNDAAGQVEKAEKAFGQFRRELGEQLIPVYIKLLQYAGFVIGVLRALPQFVSENRVAFGLLAVAVLALNQAQLIEQATTIKTLAIKKLVALGLLVEEAGSYRLAAAKTVVMRAQTLLNAAMLANPIGLVIAAVALLVAGFITLYKNVEVVRDSVNAFGEVISFVFTNIRKIAVEQLSAVGLLLEGIFTGNVSKIREGGTKLANSFREVGQGAGAAFRKGFNAERDQAAKEQEEAEAAAFKKGFDAQTARNKQALEQQQEAQVQARAATKADLLEQLKLREAALQQQLAKATEGSEQELKIKKALVLVARDQELLDEKKTAGDKAIIRAKAQVELDKLNTDYAKKQEENRKKELEKAKKQAEEEAEAEAANLKRRADLETDQYKRKAAELRAAAVAEAQKLKGTEEQIAEGRRLIAAKLEQDLLALETERVRKQTEIMQRIEQVDAQLAISRAARARQQAEQTNPLAAGGAADAERVARQAALEQELAADLARTDVSSNEKLARIRQFNEEKALIEQEYTDQARDREKAAADFVFGNAAAGVQLLADFGKIASDKELARVEKDKQARLKKTEDEYKQGKISKQEYETQKANIEANASEKTRQIKKEAAENEKKNNIAQAVIAGLLAVIKAAPNVPLQIATGVLAAGSIAKMIATPIPEFAKGGVTGLLKAGWQGSKQGFGAAYRAMKTYAHGGRINPVAGVPDVGQLHSGGGIRMVDGATGEHLGEWERGEPYMILSRNTYANNRELVDALLDTSMNRGGAPVARRGGLYAADGAVVGDLPTAQTRGIADQAQVVQAIERQTAVLQEGFSRGLVAVVQWQDSDTAELENKLDERAAIRDSYSA